MQTTEHLNLNLPEATDPYDIGNENENMEILDSAIYNHGIILGSASTAGHNKIINDLSKTSLSNGEALSARMGNALGQMFAPIESSSSASRAYAIGAQFIYNGILYKATAAISQGGNINPGGNCTAASSVTAQISDLDNHLNQTLVTNNVSTMANTPIVLENNWDTLIVQVWLTNTYERIISIPYYRGEISPNDTRVIRQGYYGGSANYAYVRVTLSTDSSMKLSVSLVEANLSGNDVLSSSRMQIQYKCR